MPNEIEEYIKKITKYEVPWCNLMGFRNPYIDPFSTYISKQIPDFDYQAFETYTKHNFVYDKLWVAKSQGLLCGKLSNLRQNDNISLPIFIKPRWGHETATSKNCFKIKSWSEVNNYKHIPDMMWSEFIDAREQMTDYILLDGKIVYQITYVYSDSQNEFIDDWKYVSPDNKPIPKITDWVNRNLSDFTGAVNVQYRDDKIIEVGLRLARGGAYILSTKNKTLIDNINNVVENSTWNYGLDNEMKFDPFYSFKCYTTLPLFYIFPQYYLDHLMNKHKCMPFYEYYFEPAGKTGMVAIQFMHKDFNSGMNAKKHIETVLNYTQFLFIFLLIISLIIFSYKKWLGVILLVITGIIFNTRFINPLGVQYQQWKAVKQQLFT